eukprot:CAMPEP_0175955982 /NCGR_PEP_ID=MMETSP0108-20121206/32806_1 /TAXON_ID=195067 ORGANISM="Goniomonas pacifica, Strain CCMP1869" /NCGR_SAMPLE_ID=MMETSP0108 /ASSEMBLY_ACC=CAM_ASM_000204 /LENGTH=75 /DNA_ID=CAMNT_0017282909 /DNA_START=193 /DNA_END=417 /DNA_ORIENTATION=-
MWMNWGAALRAARKYFRHLALNSMYPAPRLDEMPSANMRSCISFGHHATQHEAEIDVCDGAISTDEDVAVVPILY